MKKNLKTVKTGIIFGLVLISMFAVFIPNASAGLLTVDSALQVTFDKTTTEKFVVPASGPITMKILTQFEIYGAFSNLIETSLLSTSQAQIDLQVVEGPSWCTATLSPSNFFLDVNTKLSDPFIAELSISVNELAPAFEEGKVKISAHNTKITGVAFNIGEHTTEIEIPFTVGYSPAISFTTPNGNFMEIGPMDTANFEIQIENLGNAETEVVCEILNAPKDWSPNIVTAVLLGSNVKGEEGTTKTVYFKVKPPYGFGYHSEAQSFQVKLTPYYYKNPSYVGKEYILTFNIQSRGFSTYGFEILLIAIIIGIVLLYIIIMMYKKVKRKK